MKTPADSPITPLLNPLTSTGVLRLVLVPSPSSPNHFNPQHFIPPESNAQVWKLTCSQPNHPAANPITFTGVLLICVRYHPQAVHSHCHPSTSLHQ